MRLGWFVSDPVTTYALPAQAILSFSSRPHPRRRLLCPVSPCRAREPLHEQTRCSPSWHAELGNDLGKTETCGRSRWNRRKLERTISPARAMIASRSDSACYCVSPEPPSSSFERSPLTPHRHRCFCVQDLGIRVGLPAVTSQGMDAMVHVSVNEAFLTPHALHGRRHRVIYLSDQPVNREDWLQSFASTETAS